MPRKKPSILTIEEPKTPVDVVIRDSNLPDSDGKTRHYGSVVHKRVTVRASLKEMEDNHATIANKELMFYVAEELSRRMMQKFKRGYAIELLEFGTIYPAMKGSISTTDTPSQIKKHFDVGFTPSKEARAALDNLIVNNVRKVSKQHCIYTVIDMLSNAGEKNRIGEGMMTRITGKAIKLGGSKCSLYAAAVQEDWEDMLPERENWISIEHVFTNKPSTLEFYAEELPPGFYVFIVETSMSAGGKELKNSVTVHSAGHFRKKAEYVG